MRCLLLKHKKKLQYRNTVFNKFLKKYIDDSMSLIISFDDLDLPSEHTTIEEIDALDIPSIFRDYDGKNITVVNLESHTPFYPIIYWYLLHSLKVGNCIQIIEENTNNLQINKKYYMNHFDLIKSEGISKIYRKTSTLLIEDDIGLQDWSFCIPTGPGDATMLNNLVSQILQFEIPQKEILLCGRPGENFKYWNEVRIVGEDIPAPPVHITKKKNVLAKEAKYNNLCILHDRVLLPSNFYDAVLKQGDLYPIYGFQSIYMVDKKNLLPIRYSDAGCLINNKSFSTESFNKEKFLYNMINSGFSTYDIRTFPKNNYITGSLYITKKQVWLKFPQEEQLYWAEYEDIEWAVRLRHLGIPSIVNPYTITLSQRGRSLVVGSYSSLWMNNNGKLQKNSLNRFLMTVLPMKAILDIGTFEYSCLLNQYIDKYTLSIRMKDLENMNNFNIFLLRYQLIMSTPIERTRKFAEEWYKDICKYILHEQEIEQEKYDFIELISKNNYMDSELKKIIVKNIFSFRNQTYMSIFSSLLNDQRPSFYSKTYKIYSKYVAFKLLKNEIFSLSIDCGNLSKILNDFMKVEHEN